MSRLLSITFILLSSLMSTPCQAQGRDSINWISFEQLSDSLQVHPKKVILFFHTDWCSYCRKMQNEVFTDAEVISALNNTYYAVRFDAESVDTVTFEGQKFTNTISKKRTGRYHALAQLLAQREGKLVFPTAILLDEKFTVRQRYFQYLDKKKLLKAIKF